jgi:acyl-CoA reductase-like NAD-dependent aldehyde dehydrogenase
MIMSPLTDVQVGRIAEQVVELLNKSKSMPGAVPQKNDSVKSRDGVFESIDAAVQAAQNGFLQLSAISLQQRKAIIANIRKKMLEHAAELAEMAHRETGLGRSEDKLLKNRLVTEKTPGPEALSPHTFSGDHGLTLIEPAPYGVIGAITPVTNPTSTIICNTIGMVSAGNAVVFNVHPAAGDVSNYNVELLNQAITEAGGPQNLVTSITQPTIESAQQVMQHSGIRLLVVTGGSGVVRAAMTSGKRAICAGPGNPPVVIDESADLENAADCIVRGASLDNNIICVDEKSIFAVQSIADPLLNVLSKKRAVILNEAQVKQLEQVIFSDIKGPRKPAVMTKDLIGQNVQIILAKIGLNVGHEIRLAVAPVEEDHPLVWSEQMMPVLPLVQTASADAAIDIAKESEHGFRHTAVMHSKNLDNLSRMARVMNCSIFVKNGPSQAGLGHGGEGYCSFSIASPTGEGLTGPASFSRERRCVLVDHFRIV